MTIRVLLALLALGFCFQAEAAKLVLWGAGGQSCGAWTKAQAHRPPVQPGVHYSALTPEYVQMAAQLNWLDGFLSASVWFRQSNIAEGTDANGIYGWIDGYCTSHPLDQISDAAVSLLGELSKRQTAQ